uniref:Uncharacterized protein n=1 Tax=Anguilla anguilla TaxID=7936 RepID=A0A0E9SD23_ANGAN
MTPLSREIHPEQFLSSLSLASRLQDFI